MRPPIGKSYVRVRLGGGEYTYYCPGAKVGDMVRLPPNWFRPWAQERQVVALGRRYFGRIKQAERVRVRTGLT
jgi:hypothetical protein